MIPSASSLRVRAFCGLLCVSLLPGLVRAQDANPAPAPAAPAATPAPATEPAEKRLQEVLALKIDRNPNNILAAEVKLAEGKVAPDSLEMLQLCLVTGRWKAVAPFLESVPAASRGKAYDAILKVLDQAPARTGPQQIAGPDRSPLIAPLDIAELADLAPAVPTFDQIKLLAALLKRAMAAGQSIEPLMERLDKGIRWMGGTDRPARERAADLIIEVGRGRDSVRLLPTLDPKKETANFGLLEKHAKQVFAMGRQEVRDEDIMEAWRLNQVFLTAPDTPPPIRDRGWRRVADFCRWVPEETSTEFFRRVFKQGGPDALALLKNLVLQVNDDKWNREPNLRERNLRMQHRAATELLASGIQFEGATLTLQQFALNWIDEAVYTQRVYVPPQENNRRWEVDAYGNMTMVNSSYTPPQDPNRANPVTAKVMVEIAPTAAWRSAVDVALQPRLLSLEADLRIKAEDEREVLTLIEALAPLNEREAKRLANEYVRLWANLHDPQKGVQDNPQPNFYGPQIKQGIPLTRAIQQRNVEELGVVYRRLAPLKLDLDKGRLVNAFSKAHSNAEIYREESIVKVFGPMAEIDPEVLTELVGTMRHRLAVQWRKPNVQQQANTQRTDAQIDAEVGKGYELVTSLIERGLQREPEYWKLRMADAATDYDWAEFRYGKKVDLKIYAEMRNRAFAKFARAADCYAAQLSTSERRSDTPAVYRQWLNAHLGASDLGQVTRQQDPDAHGLQEIREKILALPGDLGRKHFDAMAKLIGDSMNSIPAHMKPIYLKAALVVVGESPEAEKIHQAVSYYSGLLQELELSVRVDGSATVGHEQPFGAFLTLRHTADIERESAGGFSKYLRNDTQNQQYFYNNYNGQPPVDHRDVLEKHLREKLTEGFEILSITFHDSKVQSIGYGREGWRETPLAYLLLKAKDASVDRVPAVQLNMDFSDKQGNVVLPVASAVQMIDAKSPAVAAATVKDLQVMQVLDERGLGEGKLGLEVKVNCAGLPPKFEELFDFDAAQFKVEDRTDSGVSVQRLSSEGATLNGMAERTWVFQLRQAGPGGEERGTTFRFPVPKVTAKVVNKRYEDADLVEAPAEVTLAALPGRGRHVLVWSAAGVVGLAGVGLVLLRRRKPAAAAVAAEHTAPEVVTPFTTLQFLRKLHRDQQVPLREPDRSELSQTIDRLETFYFSAQPAEQDAPDLGQIIRDWLSRGTGQRVKS